MRNFFFDIFFPLGNPRIVHKCHMRALRIRTIRDSAVLCGEHLKKFKKNSGKSNVIFLLENRTMRGLKKLPTI